MMPEKEGRYCWRNRAGPAGRPMARKWSPARPGRPAVSLKPSPIRPVPEETARVARAAFRKGNPLPELRDELGAIFADADFADLFPERGRPGLAPWRLALVTLLQFREDLSDRRAAEAVRARIDRKYLLGLELTDPGFDASVLREFRARLLEGAAEGFCQISRHFRARIPGDGPIIGQKHNISYCRGTLARKLTEPAGPGDRGEEH